MEKRIYRSTRNKIFGGVCSGLGEYFDIDPVLVRAFFVIATLGWGVSILAYIVLWIIIPSDAGRIFAERNSFYAGAPDENIGDTNKEPSCTETFTHSDGKGRKWAGIIITVTGVIFLLQRLIPELDHGHLWPLLLIVVGILIIIHKPNSK